MIYIYILDNKVHRLYIKGKQMLLEKWVNTLNMMNEFNPFQKPKSLKKPKHFGFLKVNSLFSSFWTLYKKTLTLSKVPILWHWSHEKPSLPPSVVIESNIVQFTRSGCKVVLLPHEDHFILRDKCLAILKAPTEKANMF